MRKYLLVFFCSLMFLTGCSLTNIFNKPKYAPLYCYTNSIEAKEIIDEGNYFQSVGNYGAAINKYYSAIKIDSSFCDAYVNIGFCFRQLGELKIALSWYDKSLKISPRNPVALQNYSYCLLLYGLLDMSIENYNKLVNYYPSNPEGYYGLGIALIEKQNYNEALSNTLKAINLYQQQKVEIGEEVYLLLGENYYHVGDYKMAIEAIDKVYSSYYMIPEVNYVFGMCFYKLDNPNISKAKKYLQRAKNLGFKLPDEIIKQFDL